MQRGLGAHPQQADARSTGVRLVPSGRNGARATPRLMGPSHPLATVKAPITREVLEDQVQLVTDRTQITAGFIGGVVSRRIWRFADLATRLDYLLGGFGWCYMPLHTVAGHITAGRRLIADLRQQLATAADANVPVGPGGNHAGNRPHFRRARQRW